MDAKDVMVISNFKQGDNHIKSEEMKNMKLVMSLMGRYAYFSPEPKRELEVVKLN